MAANAAKGLYRCDCEEVISSTSTLVPVGQHHAQDLRIIRTWAEDIEAQMAFESNVQDTRLRLHPQEQAPAASDTTPGR